MTAAALATLAVVCAVGAWRFTRARWTYRAPHVAIVLWQALGVTWGLAGTGALLAYALEPYNLGVLHGLHAFAVSAVDGGYGAPEPYDLSRLLALIIGLTALSVLVMVLLTAGVQTLRARHRHRTLLALIARDDPVVPGVRVLDHPGAAAYCLPGLRSQVVVSEGTLKLLSSDELTAVLAHEAAHVRERHDLVLLPFAALRRALPWSRLVGDIQAEVGLLVEMAADDVARRYCSPRRLATALLRFGTAGAVPAPHGALGATASSSAAVMARVERLVTPGPSLPRRIRYAIVAFSITLTSSAPLLWLVPH
ncbi:Zn-dependent protease with chaperone function [Streptosporangium becharense]|uniref:Zn-dependent protease with chaperone function n=1 Tax=Streptosporangium becharense TaxID=1816182 RepID=A0A7W9IGM4_9ACTN|nr:M56 family metallopeptidase [Streptosporangium becharense]MBB2909267.1 Zn-dependent protease with chaperone function [Streptosporangium becharense]MBB5819714.1 Zn-dependent protease with chaperone function [Streptosporangium becharense]